LVLTLSCICRGQENEGIIPKSTKPKGPRQENEGIIPKSMTSKGPSVL
jgi:hypothetical protein